MAQPLDLVKHLMTAFIYLNMWNPILFLSLAWKGKNLFSAEHLRSSTHIPPLSPLSSQPQGIITVAWCINLPFVPQSKRNNRHSTWHSDYSSSVPSLNWMIPCKAKERVTSPNLHSLAAWRCSMNDADPRGLYDSTAAETPSSGERKLGLLGDCCT